MNIWLVFVFCAQYSFPCLVECNDLVINTEEDPQKTSFIYQDKQQSMSVQKIANYLRNAKFNWNYTKGNENAHSSPEHLHYEVQEYCGSDFNKCITYLQSVIGAAPASEIEFMDIPQIDAVKYKYPMPENKVYDNKLEKLKWDKTAAYYMCWYTMRGTLALSMLGESCDPLAVFYSTRNINHDPRADDKTPFACAKYSFCEDPCCPFKHVQTLRQCYNNVENPCYFENRNRNERKRACKMKQEENESLKGIIQNHWNVSCNCQDKGFIWKSVYGMCVDINECTTGRHICDSKSEVCLNLPGTYKCVCKKGYVYNHTGNYCAEVEKPKQRKHVNNNQDFYSLIVNFFTNTLKLF